MIDPHVTDEALMIRFQQGDRAAFAALVARDAVPMLMPDRAKPELEAVAGQRRSS